MKNHTPMEKSQGLLHEMGRNKATYMLLLPAILFMLVIVYYPACKGLIMSFQHYNFAGESTFAGLSHYQEILTDIDFWKAFKNTIILGGGSLVIGYSFQILIAILLNELASPLFRRVTQTVTYLPSLFSWVAVGGIWIMLLAPDTGFVNQFLGLFGVEPIGFMTRSNLAAPVFIFVNVWKTAGYSCIIFLAAIISVDHSLYEAAKIDGASRLKQITHVMLPAISGTMKSVFLLNLLAVFRTFDQPYIMSNPTIADNMEVIMTYTYKLGIRNFRFDYAAAVAMIVIVMALIVLGIKAVVAPDENGGAVR